MLPFSVQELFKKLQELEARMDRNDQNMAQVFQAIRQLMAPPDVPRRQVGFKAE